MRNYWWGPLYTTVAMGLEVGQIYCVVMLACGKKNVGAKSASCYSDMLCSGTLLLQGEQS